MNYFIPDYNPYDEFSDLQHFVFYDKYSRFLPQLGRRETWLEAVTRTTDTLVELSNYKLDKAVYQAIFESIYTLDVLPSMRLFSMSMDAIARDNTVIYNCSAIPVKSIKDFADCLYLSMSGVGIGVSIEKQYISHLPFVNNKTGVLYDFVVEDSQSGWADSFAFLLKTLFNGGDVHFDYSRVRQAGSPLMTKGGYASGPQPLIDLHEHTKNIFRQKEGRRLDSLAVLDIITKIGDCAVSGGSRRSAISVLFDEADNAILTAKSNGFYEKYPWRANSNNSAVWYDSTPAWVKEELVYQLFEHGNGEPGIWNKSAQFRSLPRYRYMEEEHILSNPCFEINLNPREFCNLSTAILRPGDTESSINRKVTLATIIGTIQSAATHFPYVHADYSKNGENDRLLGVCLTGIADTMRDSKLFEPYKLSSYKDTSVHVNKKYAEKLGINPSAAITAVKPSGNTSVLTATSPGINPEHSRYSIRNVRVNKHSAMYNFLYSNRVPSLEHPFSESDVLFGFPYMSIGDYTLENVGALDQLATWQKFKKYYTEHNPSISVTYREDEVPYVKHWIKYNSDIIGGIAFFPSYDVNLPYLPIQVVDKKSFEVAESNMPKLDWRTFSKYENNKDERQATVECSGDRCDILY